MDHTQEQQWIAQARQGDQVAFEQLVHLYEKRIYALALRMCGSPEDAAEVAQEAFLAAWRGLPTFRGEAGFSTWLYRLASNAAIDHLRRAKKQRGDLSLDDEDLGLDAVSEDPGPQDAAERQELRQAVTAALRLLSDDHRQVLVLREIQSLSYEEIAEVLELDLGTVKSRISRARSALRKILLESGNLSGYLPSNLVKRPSGREGC